MNQAFKDRRMKVEREHQARAVSLRLEGHTYAQIAEVMGCSAQHAQNLVWEVLEPERYRQREEKRKKRQRSYRAKEHGKRTGGAPRGKRERDRARELNRAYMAERREERKALIEAIKSKPCADCGGRFPPICFDFDHRPGTEKRFNIGERYASVSLEALQAELTKCDLVCANCHRLRTWGRYQELKTQGGRRGLHRS